jgi:hypothetical protein
MANEIQDPVEEEVSEQLRRGGTIKWRRYNAFTVSAAPLTEGVTPSRQPWRNPNDLH